MGPARQTLIRALTWPLAPALILATLVVDLHAGSGTSLVVADVPIVLAMATCWLVGVLVTGRSFSQGAGWAFLGLGTALAWSALTDEYVARVIRDAPDADRRPGTDVFAVLSDSSFVWWFVFLALVLQLTPPGRREGRLGRWLPTFTVASGVVFQVAALLRSERLDPPLEDFVSPFAVRPIAGPVGTVAAVSIYLLGLCLIASVIVLVAAWRRARGDARRQLLWLAAGAAPVAPAVVAAFVLSGGDQYAGASVVLGLAIVSLVLGAGFSVLRYRLYDVERVVTQSAAYAIASVSIVAVFVAVVVVVSRSTPIAGGSQPVTIAATLAGVAVARASYLWGRRAVGRRVNRALFDAVETVRAGLAAPPRTSTSWCRPPSATGRSWCTRRTASGSRPRASTSLPAPRSWTCTGTDPSWPASSSTPSTVTGRSPRRSQPWRRPRSTTWRCGLSWPSRCRPSRSPGRGWRRLT